MTENNANLYDNLIHLELTKSEIKNTKVKKFLPAVAVGAAYCYAGIPLAIGLVLGYIVSKLFMKHFAGQGKVDFIYIDCGKWKIHCHHWILGAIFLALVWVVDFFYMPTLFVGAVLGIMAQDIYDYNDWMKVIVKKPAEELAKEEVKI
jgi:hypothetical protein